MSMSPVLSIGADNALKYSYSVIIKTSDNLKWSTNNTTFRPQLYYTFIPNTVVAQYKYVILSLSVPHSYQTNNQALFIETSKSIKPILFSIQIDKDKIGF